MSMEEEQIVLQGEYEDFIGSYSGVLDSQFCKEIMDEFDYFHDIGSVWCGDKQFDNTMAGRFDYALDLHNMGNLHLGTEYSQILNQKLWECFGEYARVFGTLNNSGPYTSVHQKVQKTPAGGGYHVWHCENSSMTSMSSRAMVWMFYLNDDYKGGETEFLYYKKRVQPEQGKLLIWPAGYTHAHRGNMVLEGMKYIVTGWIYYGERNEE